MKKSIIKNSIITFFIVLLMVLTLFPFYVLIVKSFKSSTQDIYSPYSITFPLQFSNYRYAWSEVSSYMLNSLFVACVVSFLVVFICSYTAYIFVKFKFKGKNVLFTVILALMMVPSIISLVPQYLLLIKFNMIGTFAGVIIFLTVGNIPYGTFLMRTFISGISKELYEAAELDGAGKFRVYFSIVIPMAIPIMLTLGLSAFLGAWNDYLWTLLVLRNSFEKYTIAIGLVSLTNAMGTRPINIPLAGFVICSLPLIIIFAFVSKQFIGGITSGALKM